jgi:hypothetical protein
MAETEGRFAMSWPFGFPDNRIPVYDRPIAGPP